MSIQDFLKPRLTGARFEGKAIPLEMLKDLAVLEEMVIEVAKWKFLQANQERSRSPRGFTEGIELKLTGLEEGSAKPIISLIIAGASLFSPANEGYCEQARDAIVSAIAAADRNEPVTRFLPPTALTYFDRMGRSLRDGEAMEFVNLPSLAPARLTKESRKRLVLASEGVTEITEETSVRGSICEADQLKMTFEVQLLTGQKVVDIPIDPPHLDTILEAFSKYKKGARVLIQGIGRFNRQARLEGFERIQHIQVLDPLDISSRLDELRNLQNGWLDGRGTAPSTNGLSWLTAAFDKRFPEDLPLPFLYPTPEGGIQAEWRLPPFEISLEIDLARHAATLHSLNMESSNDVLKELDLNSEQDWISFFDHLRNPMGAA
jgi:hypothetical protein